MVTALGSIWFWVSIPEAPLPCSALLRAAISSAALDWKRFAILGIAMVAAVLPGACMILVGAVHAWVVAPDGRVGGWEGGEGS